MTQLAIGFITTPAPWPRGMAFARTFTGRLILVSLFTLALVALRMPHAPVIGAFLGLCSVLPDRRKSILTAAAAMWILLMPPIDWLLLQDLALARHIDPPLSYGWFGIPLAWALVCGYLWLIRAFPQSPPGRRPIIGLISLLIGLLALSRVAAMPPTLWVIVTGTAMAFGRYLWFFAFWISQNASRSKLPTMQQTFAARPFWGFSVVPYGKGAAYLEKVEAKNDEQLLATQLSGCKLLLRAIVFTAILFVAVRCIYRSNGSVTSLPYATQDALIPTYQMCLDAMKAGTPYPLPMRWVALVLYFSLRVATLTVFGAKVIAIARMAGFNAFRNTYRPFSATSIAEFYNRVYYYFKELMVAFFFYPTYLRYFKKHPRVRLFVATLAAAGVGNFVFHFLRDDHYILRDGFGEALRIYASYAVYALVLGSIIAYSQMKLMSRKGPGPAGLRKAVAIAGVMLFYCFISIIEEPNRQHQLGDYASFFLSLFRP